MVESNTVYSSFWNSINQTPISIEASYEELHRQEDTIYKEDSAATFTENQSKITRIQIIPKIPVVVIEKTDQDSVTEINKSEIPENKITVVKLSNEIPSEEILEIPLNSEIIPDDIERSVSTLRELQLDTDSQLTSDKQSIINIEIQLITENSNINKKDTSITTETQNKVTTEKIEAVNPEINFGTKTKLSV